MFRLVKSMGKSMKMVRVFFSSFFLDLLIYELGITAPWLAQLVECQSAVREVDSLSPRPDQHSGS